MHTVVVLDGCRKDLVGTGWAISFFFNTNGRRKGSSATVDNFQPLESSDHCKLANEWVWQRSWTLRGLMEEPLAQVFSATSQQKWKYGWYKISIASKRPLENATLCIMHSAWNHVTKQVTGKTGNNGNENGKGMGICIKKLYWQREHDLGLVIILFTNISKDD